MVTVIVAYSVINFIIQSVIQPKVVGDVVGLTATLSFVSLIFWTWVIGPLGAILAIPLTVLAKAVLLDMRIVETWAAALDATRARRLGFTAETSFDEIIRVHIEDELGGSL